MKKFFTFVTIFLASISFSQDLSQNLLLLYPFNGNSEDFSGNDHSGIPSNITYGPDRNGNPEGAAYFNGINSFVDFPNLELLKPQLPVSFSFWIKYTSDDYHKQVVFNTSYEENRCTGVWFNSSLENNGHAINFGNGEYYYAPESRRTFLCQRQIDLGTWHLITAVVNSASNMQIYIDCVLRQGNYSGFGESLVYSSTPGTIGRHDRNLDLPTDYFQGYIDDFRYWDRALSPEDILQLCSNLSVSKEVVTNKNVLIYPNPADTKLFIETELKEYDFSLYNNLGQRVEVNLKDSSVDVSGLEAGIYFLRIKSANFSETKKIIIK